MTAVTLAAAVRKHHSAGMAKVQISKIGRAVSMEGVAVDFTPAMLSEVAATYNPSVHEAPIVIGHPTAEAPAFGWIKGLSFSEKDGLMAEETQLDEQFAEARRNGRWKKPSASFYTPTAPNNPTPGKWHLRHVGFLGGTPPAVKGLRVASFAEREEGVVTFGDLPAYTGSFIAAMFRGLRDWLIEKDGQEVADRVMPSWRIESLSETATRADDQPGLSFSDPRPPTASKEHPSMKSAEELQAELDAERNLRTAAEGRAKTLQEGETRRQADMRHAEHASFADTLVAQSRWPAGAKEILVATLDHLATPGAKASAASPDVVSFGEGDQAKPLHQVLREQLQALPEQVSFAEHAGRRKSGSDGLSDREISDRASAYRDRQASAGRNISMSQALDAVHAGKDKE